MKLLSSDELIVELQDYIHTGIESNKLKEHKGAMVLAEIEKAKSNNVFRKYNSLYNKAKLLEKDNINSALEIYLNILHNYEPEGTAYFVRPCILLEKLKRYDEAIEICLRAINEIELSKFNASKDEFEKRIERLVIKKGKLNTLSTKKSSLSLSKHNNSIAPLKREEVSQNVRFPDWYIMISFGKSSSSNYIKAVTLAKHASIYQEQEDDGNITHSAIYGKSKKEYLSFIQLYETVSNWKSTFVICNGEIIDRKIVGQLNYCYGDKCRSGKVDFCYGASMFTDNPFGCHRLQISRFNNPWWSFYREIKGEYILDKGDLYERADSVAEAYNYCPDFDLNTIKHVIN